jgi:enterochelin esterase-like enzyme
MRAMKLLLRALLMLLPLATVAQPLPSPSTGRIERLANFASKNVAPRHVDVWLPADYSETKRYAVLYMQDGQMLFDARSTWNQQAWMADATVARLVQEGRIPDTLIVGVWNGGEQRYAEYFPQKVLAGAPTTLRHEYVSKAQNGKAQADAYLRFLVEELKPAIDRRFSTKAGPRDTFIAGSSMGGLISLYALCEYPQVFGGAAALSAHWVGIPTAWGQPRMRSASLPLALLSYLAVQLPPAGRHRLWVDRGSDELDSLYAPSLGLFADVLRDRGYTEADAVTRVFEGTGHNERDWAARLDAPLQFLLAPRR